MNMEIVVAIIAGLFSISVSIFGAVFINLNNVKLQTRKLKEEHYVRYIESVHNLAADNSSTNALREYTLHRDKMFIVASEKVITAMLEFEEKAFGKKCDKQDEYLTNLVEEIRKDLSIRDKSFPQIHLKASKRQ
ncbi:MAG: hypothetical protein ACI4LC_00080 [Emergencia sp.]